MWEHTPRREDTLPKADWKTKKHGIPEFEIYSNEITRNKTIYEYTKYN